MTPQGKSSSQITNRPCHNLRNPIRILWNHNFFMLKPIFQSYPNWLVVYLPLWKIWKSVGMILPNIWKMFQTTNQPILSHSYPLYSTLSPFYKSQEPSIRSGYCQGATAGCDPWSPKAPRSVGPPRANKSPACSPQSWCGSLHHGNATEFERGIDDTTTNSTRNKHL